MPKKRNNLPTMPRGRLVNKNGSAAGANSTALSVASIRCHVCHKIKGAGEYSNRQLSIYKNTINNPYTPGGSSQKHMAICKGCTANCVSQLTCSRCGETMPLDKFKKTQRRTPDEARCLKCVQICLDNERNGEVYDSDKYASDSDDDDSSLDDDYGEDVDAAEASDSEQDVDKVSDGEDTEDEAEPISAAKAKTAANVAGVMNRVGSMSLSASPPGRLSGVVTPNIPATNGGTTPATGNNAGGPWQTIATRSWASRAASATPSGSNTPSTMQTGYTTPRTAASTPAAKVTNTGWAKTKKSAMAAAAAEDNYEWASKNSSKLGWGIAGQAPLVNRKSKKKKTGGKGQAEDERPGYYVD